MKELVKVIGAPVGGTGGGSAQGAVTSINGSKPDAQGNINVAVMTPEQEQKVQQVDAVVGKVESLANQISQMLMTNTKQELTEQQKAQGRENLGAVGIDSFNTTNKDFMTLIGAIAGQSNVIIWEDFDGTIHYRNNLIGDYTTTRPDVGENTRRILACKRDPNANSMYCMVNIATSMEEFIPIIDTRGVTDMRAMFSNNIRFINGFSSYDVSKVTMLHTLVPCIQEYVDVIAKWELNELVSTDSQGIITSAYSEATDIDISNWKLVKCTNFRLCRIATRLHSFKCCALPAIYKDGKFIKGIPQTYNTLPNADILTLPDQCPLMFDGQTITMVDGAFYTPLDLYYEQETYFNMDGREDQFIEALGTFVHDEQVGLAEYGYLCIENPNDHSRVPIDFLPTINVNKSRYNEISEIQKQAIANKGWTLVTA